MTRRTAPDAAQTAAVAGGSGSSGGRRLYVGVIGADSCPPQAWEAAARVGEGLARAGAIVVCGGRGGVMEAAAQGASRAGGLVVGVLPGPDRSLANRFLTVSLPTGMGQARNVIIVLSSHAIVALSGGYGTLSEIGCALKHGVPVVGLDTWVPLREGRPPEGLHPVAGPEEAVELALRLARARASRIA
ncbi:MAG: TIGR00725 family protein [Acetobacteraceae bacterium]|nr:TIGR00725 family protein [Acetobacteraceae bacterium]